MTENLARPLAGWVGKQKVLVRLLLPSIVVYL